MITKTKKKIKNKITGDKESFIKSWQGRKEGLYNHWTRDEPKNQIQLAFREHWKVFQELLKNKLFNKGKRCLEVGCGRGTASAYFSDAGYNCTLLDISHYSRGHSLRSIVDSLLSLKHSAAF